MSWKNEEKKELYMSLKQPTLKDALMTRSNDTNVIDQLLGKVFYVSFYLKNF